VQVGCQGFADLGKQRQAMVNESLPRNHDLARFPVDVVEREGDDLACTQAKPGQKEDDRVVAPPSWCALVAGPD
jgi:hypothetical protein